MRCASVPSNLSPPSLLSPLQELPGFSEDAKEETFVTTGFARTAVLGVAVDVVRAVKEGNLKHIFLIGGWAM